MGYIHINHLYLISFFYILRFQLVFAEHNGKTRTGIWEIARAMNS